MNDSEPKTQKITEIFLHFLKVQKDQEGWSSLAHEKLGKVTQLNNLRKSIQQLVQGKNSEEIARRCEYLVSQLFSEKFLRSSAKSDFLESINAVLFDRPYPISQVIPALLYPVAETPPDIADIIDVSHQDVSHQDVTYDKNPERSKAMILLDADQLTIDRDTEIQLEKRTNSQILYRIAFANWKSKNNDRALHERHYLLIHLPAGRDKADGGMIMFGSSIREHYPDVNCIFICSNDQIFISLATGVIQLGLQAYRLNQTGQEIHVKSLNGIESWMIRPSIPIATLLGRLRDLIEKEGRGGWILIPAIEESYQKHYGQSFASDLNNRPPYHSLVEFLKHYPKHFVVHVVDPDGAEIYVNCFRSPLLLQSQDSQESQTPIPGLTPTSKQLSQLPRPPEIPEISETSNPSSQKIQDFEAFEAKVIQALRSLLSDPSKKRLENDYFSLADLSTTFQTLHQAPINQLCLQATDKRIGVVLSSQLLKTLKTQKKGNTWWIGLK